MKQVQRIAAVALVAGAALIGGMFGGKAIDAGAAGTTVNCNIPQAVVCTVSNPAGIKSVRVDVNFGGGIGTVAVVDKSYAACPTSVQVSWDPIVPNANFTVEECSGLKLSNGQPGVVGAGTLKGIIAIAPAGPSSPRTATFLKNAGGGGDPKPLGLKANTSDEPGVVRNIQHCSSSEVSGNFTLCDQHYVIMCNALGGTFKPDGHGNGDCDGVHDNAPPPVPGN